MKKLSLILPILLDETRILSFDIFKLLHYMEEWEYLKLHYISVVKSKLILQKHEIIYESDTSVLLRSD